jgi:hypothetical protein
MLSESKTNVISKEVNEVVERLATFSEQVNDDEYSETADIAMLSRTHG